MMFRDMEIIQGNPQKPLISLTFDAGSDPAATPSILDTLRQKGVYSTFFLTGAWVEKNPEMAEQILYDGHEVGNHSYSHPDFTLLSNEEIIDQISHTEEAVLRVTGKSTRPWFRPPKGARDARVLKIVSDLGYQSVYWTLDSADWRDDPTPQKVHDQVLTSASNGAIILFHAHSVPTSQCLRRIIDGLRARGYELVTISQLLATP